RIGYHCAVQPASRPEFGGQDGKEVEEEKVGCQKEGSPEEGRGEEKGRGQESAGAESSGEESAGQRGRLLLQDEEHFRRLVAPPDLLISPDRRSRLYRVSSRSRDQAFVLQT